MGRFISDLKDLRHYGTGSWGLPEFGFTEKFFDGRDTSVELAKMKRSGDIRTPNTDPYAGIGENEYPEVKGGSIYDNTSSDGGGDGEAGGGDGGGGGGSWDKSGMAENLGWTSEQFEDIANRYGYDSTEDFFNSGILQEIESAYGATTDYLNKAENRLGDDKKLALENINQLMGESMRNLRTQSEVQERQLGQQVSEAKQRERNALADAVRTYNELARGGLQRFGGSSSAGEAFQAIGGQQLQQNRQRLKSQFNQFANQVAVARQNIEQQLSTALQNLESQKIRLQNEARRDFQNRLTEIDRMKSEAESAKANARLQALQQLRNQQFEIRMATLEAQAEARAEANAMNQAVQQYMQEQVQNVDPNIVSDQAQAFNTNIQSRAQNPQYVGSIRRDDEDLMAGGLSLS